MHVLVLVLGEQICLLKDFIIFLFHMNEQQKKKHLRPFRLQIEGLAIYLYAVIYTRPNCFVLFLGCLTPKCIHIPSQRATIGPPAKRHPKGVSLAGR